MKKLICLPFFLFFLPNSVNAESHWLILRYVPSNHSSAGAALEKIKMKSKDQCQTQGALWMGTKETKVESKKKSGYGFVCLVGE